MHATQIALKGQDRPKISASEMKTSRILLLALAFGALLTLLSGLVSNTPAGLLGAVHYGYPLPWLHQVVYPGAPMEVDPVIMLVDIAVWSVVGGLVLLLLGSIVKT